MAYFDADMDTEPIFDRMDIEYTIYVNNLPPELDEDAIKEVFNQYGKISGMCYPPNATWAYITYKSYREAELAIRELNNKKPLYLKVALAKERSVIREEKLPKSYVSESFGGRPRAIDTLAEPSISIHNDMKHQNGVGRGQTLNALRKHFAPQMTSDRYAENASLFPPNLYDIEEPTVNTNRLWTRGVISVTEDGRRHVSLGRGYTLYEFPEQNPKVEECIVDVLEKRQKGLYEYGEDKFKNGIQRCHICSNKTSKHCEKCSTYYCSKVCQKNDWPRHQVECQQIPRLVEEPINDMSSLQISKDENQMKIPSMSNKTITPNEIKLRRPNAMQAENSNSTNANINMHKNNVEITNCSIDSDVNSQDKHMSIRHDNNTNVSYTKTIDQQTLSTMNTKDFSKQNQLQRCNNTKEDTEKSRRNDEYSLTTSNFSNQNHSHHNGAIKKTSPRNGKFDNSSLRSKSYNNDRSQSYQKNELQNNRKSTTYNEKLSIDREIVNRQESNSSSNSIAMDDDLTFCKNMYLSKTEFTEVEILISLDNGEYWVSTLKDSEARTKLMTELQSVARKSRNVQPIIGDIYGVLYETLWHRAMIISLNPLKVHFIDYGNDEILQKDTEIRDISNMIKVPHLARKIRLTSAANEKYNFQYGEIIFVKMLFIDAEKTIIVDVKEQSRKLSSHLENASNTNNTVENFVRQENLKVSDENVKPSMAQTPPTILDAFADLFSKKATPELEFEGFIQIYESVQENIYSATLGAQDFTTEIEMLFNDLQEECMKTQETVHYNPQVEDLICGEGKEAWCRGYILPSLTSPDLRIIAIDEARYMNVNKILPCPKKFLNICAIGVICEVSHPNKLTVGEVYQFTTIMNEQNHKQDNLKIKIFKKSEFVCEAMMKSWKFMIRSSFPAFSEIKSGSKICLTSYRNHYQVFARSLDEEAIEYYNNIMQRVAQCARTAPLLSNPPYNKQAVIAPFSDNNSYRALIINTHNDKAKIVYTDFGNVDDVNIKDLQVLPETLALQRSCSAKISLKNVPSEVSMNTEVDLFLRELAGNETSLTCVYEGDPLKDGVYLTMPTGESVNDKINQLLTPTWKQKDHCDNNCYMLDNIEFASLGQVGDTLHAVILHTPKENDGTRYMMGPNDIELYTYISEVMPKLLREYCEKTEYYIPREQELCLALYQNEWYRAACLDPKKSYTTAEVFYIDYGNIDTVEHRNIRLMPKDFITPAAMSNICTVVNLAPVDNAGNYSPIIREKILELIEKNGPMIKIKIVDYDSGDYKIELPDIKNTLIGEGLIPSS